MLLFLSKCVCVCVCVCVMKGSASECRIESTDFKIEPLPYLFKSGRRNSEFR